MTLDNRKKNQFAAQQLTTISTTQILHTAILCKLHFLKISVNLIEICYLPYLFGSFSNLN